MFQASSRAVRKAFRVLPKIRQRPNESARAFSISNQSLFANAETLVTEKNHPDETIHSSAGTVLISARPIDTRKSQLIRVYTSLLRTTPLILFFQHSNLTAVEWAAVRRELRKAISAVPRELGSETSSTHNVSSQVQLQAVRTNMLAVALKIVEFHKPDISSNLESAPPLAQDPPVHDLSELAYRTVGQTTIPPDSEYAQLQPLMCGPLAALIMPAVSPAYLAAALGVLAPVAGLFPAPSRRKCPSYYDPVCQNGLAKLLLVGGRIDGKILDQPGVNWVGGLHGGLDGLRAQLSGLLQSAGVSLTTTFDGSSRNLWVALEGRKVQLGGSKGSP